MTNKILAKSMLIWAGIIPLAFINGALREVVLIPLLGQPALILSGIILSAMIFFLAYAFIPRLGKATRRTYIIMGLLWVLSTIIFEFLLGFLMGDPLADMLSAYNIFTGNIWSLVVLFIGFVPWIVAKLKRFI